VGSRTLVRLQSTRTVKKTGVTSVEDRYYLSSQDLSERSPENWIDLSREHWAGVENRNHWRRDASLGEDGTRLRQRHALGNLALLRSVTLRLLAADAGATDDPWLPAKKERLAADPTAALNLLRLRL
jgi:predicted transposase YbfD/YdcC